MRSSAIKRQQSFSITNLQNHFLFGLGCENKGLNYFALLGFLIIFARQSIYNEEADLHTVFARGAGV